MLGLPGGGGGSAAHRAPCAPEIRLVVDGGGGAGAAVRALSLVELELEPARAAPLALERPDRVSGRGRCSAFRGDHMYPRCVVRARMARIRGPLSAAPKRRVGPCRRGGEAARP